MEDWFSGLYIKPFSMAVSRPSYDNSLPHRHDFYYCILVESGKLEIEVDFEKVHLTDNSFFLSYPGQIHSVISVEGKRGWFLAFDPAMLDAKLKEVLDQFLPEIVSVSLQQEQMLSLSTFADQLFSTYNDHSNVLRAATTQSMVTAFVYQLASRYLTVERFGLVKHTARAIELTKRFKQLLRSNFKLFKKTSEYAAKLNITASHLNDTVRDVTGFSVLYFVQQEMMHEAKRLLYHSDLSVKEIANVLGFEDAQYFNRLFSKVIGTSPGVFRKKNVVVPGLRRMRRFNLNSEITDSFTSEQNN